MPDFRVPLVNNEFYHIFNRGVARNPIFTSKSDYRQAMLSLQYYKYRDLPMKLARLKELTILERNNILSSIQSRKKYVEIISFVLMPNHFHFLLKQTSENGISRFISQFTNSYTRYFNTKHDRVGALLQGVFKAVHVETDEQLLHLSRYIHINPVVSFIIKESELFSYPWSSLPLFLKRDSSIGDSRSILDRFSSIESYKQFLLDNISYGKELDKIKHLTFE